jgi:hypothetical protein
MTEVVAVKDLNKKTMKSKLIFVFCLFFLSLNAQKNIHHRWNQMLNKYVSENGQVNYKAWMFEQDNLDAYIRTLEGFHPKKKDSKNQKLAFWINLHNALTVQLILKKYPIKSINNINGLWEIKCFSSLNKEYTLGDIKNKLLRKMNEPRIHFAINFTSKSGPRLLNQAFQERNLENQLRQITNDFLKDSTKNKISSNQLKLSEIFKRFENDFGTKDQIYNFIQTYTGVSLNVPKINYLVYNWDLNELNSF